VETETRIDLLSTNVTSTVLFLCSNSDPLAFCACTNLLHFLACPTAVDMCSINHDASLSNFFFELVRDESGDLQACQTDFSVLFLLCLTDLSSLSNVTAEAHFQPCCYVSCSKRP
jgi:hypothetical protein